MDYPLGNLITIIISHCQAGVTGNRRVTAFIIFNATRMQKPKPGMVLSLGDPKKTTSKPYALNINTVILAATGSNCSFSLFFSLNQAMQVLVNAVNINSHISH